MRSAEKGGSGPEQKKGSRTCDPKLLAEGLFMLAIYFSDGDVSYAVEGVTKQLVILRKQGDQAGGGEGRDAGAGR